MQYIFGVAPLVPCIVFWVQCIFGVASLVLCIVSSIAQACYRSGASTLYIFYTVPPGRPKLDGPVHGGGEEEVGEVDASTAVVAAHTWIKSLKMMGGFQKLFTESSRKRGEVNTPITKKITR